MTQRRTPNPSSTSYTATKTGLADTYTEAKPHDVFKHVFQAYATVPSTIYEARAEGDRIVAALESHAAWYSAIR